MQDLELVGVHDDGEHVLLTGHDGSKYLLPINEPLRAAVRRDRARLGQLQIAMDGGLRPRDIQARIRGGQSAAEIAELAGLCGLDPAKLERVVAGYNAAVRPGTFRGGVLDDCRTEGIAPPKSHWARRIERPPFHAHPLRPGITFTFLGVKVNERARVMMADGKPSANMFASGEIMAGNILGQGYLAGFGMTIGTVFGRIAGEEAARHARN